MKFEWWAVVLAIFALAIVAAVIIEVAFISVGPNFSQPVATTTGSSTKTTATVVYGPRVMNYSYAWTRGVFNFTVKSNYCGADITGFQFAPSGVNSPVQNVNPPVWLGVGDTATFQVQIAGGTAYLSHPTVYLRVTPLDHLSSSLNCNSEQPRLSSILNETRLFAFNFTSVKETPA